MQEYRIFLSDEPGAFGKLRHIFFVNEEAAKTACRRLLNEFAGVDIWCGDRRVALLTRWDARAAGESFAPAHPALPAHSTQEAARRASDHRPSQRTK